MEKSIINVCGGDCTGCGACYNACPFGAIKMEYDSEGFLFPSVDSGKCVDCGRCLSACPVASPVYKNNAEPKCYAMWAEDDIRKKSSSGGAFTVLAEAVLSEGGAVCGAVLESDNVTVVHKFIESREKLSLLQGSKYVQSNSLNTFAEAEKYLKSGRCVLYSGCPCQIAGLNKYLGHEYDNLVTIDLLCHGVPSSKVLKKYISEKEAQHGKISNLKFRTKELAKGGWSKSVCVAFDTSEGRIVEERKDSDFLNAFLTGLSVRGGCGSCRFAKLPRQGDITLGDFWGIAKHASELDDDFGTSAVLINSERGRRMLDSISESCKRLEEVPIEWAVDGNKNIAAPPWVNPRNKRYYDILDKYNLAKAFDYGKNRKFDIGFVGWWYGANYGSVLTNFALHEVLTKKLDKTVLMISYPDTDPYKADSRAERFAKKHYEMSMKRKLSEYEDLNYFCEKFVLGSDQLWNWYSINELGNFYLLDFVHKNKIKIAYGTSFGHSRSFFPLEDRIRTAELLQEFDSVSVREEEGVDILYRDFGVYSKWVLDPVFLCEKEVYDAAADESEYFIDEPYLFAYILNPTEEKRCAVYEAAKFLDKKPVTLIDGQSMEKDKLAEIMGGTDVLREVEIETWLRLIRDADFVITDSFHGTCFSIINGKNFLSIKNRKRGNSRFQSLMRMVGLEDRLVEEDFSEERMKELYSQPVAYERCNGILKQEKADSLNWLKQALDRPKQPVGYNEIVRSLLQKQEERISALEKQMENDRLNEKQVFTVFK